MAACLFIPVALLAAPKFVKTPKVEPNPNAAAPLAAVLSFSTGEPVSTSVHVSEGEERRTIRFPASRRPEKGFPILGLRPGRQYSIWVTIRDAKGASITTQTPVRFTAPPLPKDIAEIPPLKVTVREPAKMEPGFTLFAPRRSKPGDLSFGASYGMLLAVDDAGEVVWYYRTDSRISDMERRKNGNIVYITQDYRAREIDMLGNVVREWYAAKRPAGAASGALAVDTTTFHHEVDELPNGNLVILGSEVREIDDYYTSETDANAPRKRQKVMGDEVVEFDNNGKVVWRWNAFDNMDVQRLGYETFGGYWDRRGFPGVIDWSHANGLMYDPKDDSLLVCFRYQAAVLKIDRKTKQIKWIAGNPAGWKSPWKDKLLALEGADRWFYYQHAPHPTPRGTLLIFDNGSFQTMPFTPALAIDKTFSRAVEYQIDEVGRTARQVWVSEESGTESVIATAMGDVDWMPKTGNVLVHYGALLSRRELDQVTWENMQTFPRWTRIREYRRTQPAELVWELVVGNPEGTDPVAWILFGGDRIASLE